VSTRDQAAAELRQKIEKGDPVLLTLIDGLKVTFSARLRYVRLGDGTELGNKNEFEERGFVPAPLPVFRHCGESSVEFLRKQEREHIDANSPKPTRAAPRRGTAVRGRR